jgi:WD40 repeat protein
MALRAPGQIASARIHVREGDGPWRAITPEGVGLDFVVSPDGEQIAAQSADGTVIVFAVGGKAPQPLHDETGTPVHWTREGALLLKAPELFPARVYRRHLASGRVEPWLTLSPADVSGVMFIARVLVANDDRSYVYQYSRGLGDLFLGYNLK